MNKLHEIIDKLIEIRVTSELSPKAGDDLDFVIESLIGEAGIVPDFRDMTPEELEDVKYFESVIKDMIEHRLAMAWPHGKVKWNECYNEVINTMKNDRHYKVNLSNKHIQFLVKCIDISQSTQSIKPDKSETEIINELGKLNDEIQEDKYGDSIYYDLSRG